MWQWLRELYEINAEFRENRLHCKSCETLRLELDRCNREKSQLLSNLIAPKPEEPKREPPLVTAPLKLGTPWIVKQRMLEAEDRQKAKIIRDLEERMGIKNAIPTAGVETFRKEAEREDSGGEAPRSRDEGGGEDSERGRREEEKETTRSADGSI